MSRFITHALQGIIDRSAGPKVTEPAPRLPVASNPTLPVARAAPAPRVVEMRVCEREGCGRRVSLKKSRFCSVRCASLVREAATRERHKRKEFEMNRPRLINRRARG